MTEIIEIMNERLLEDHKKKLEEAKLTCPNCHKLFRGRSGIYRHRKKCVKNSANLNPMTGPLKVSTHDLSSDGTFNKLKVPTFDPSKERKLLKVPLMVTTFDQLKVTTFDPSKVSTSNTLKVPTFDPLNVPTFNPLKVTPTASLSDPLTKALKKKKTKRKLDFDVIFNERKSRNTV